MGNNETPSEIPEIPEITEEEKNKLKENLKKGINIQIKFNKQLQDAEEKINKSVDIQNQIMSDGNLDCSDITFEKLNFTNQDPDPDKINEIINEIRSMMECSDIEGFENDTKLLFEKFSFNDHCIYILIILFLILIFKDEIIKSKYFKKIFS